MNEELDNLRLSDFEGDLKLVAEALGIPFALQLREHFGGCSLYIQKDGVTTARNRVIRRSYTGTNASELAQRYNLSMRQVRRIVHDESGQQVSGSATGTGNGERDLERSDYNGR